MTEQLPYEVLATFPEFEVRRYSDYDVVQCLQAGEFTEAGNRAFSPLFQFISGNNSDGARIAMTAPVLQEERAHSQHAVSFVMPHAVTGDRIPAPSNARLSTKHVAGHDAVVRRFSGGWSAQRMHEQAEQLRRAVERAGLTTEGAVTFARFDPPWKPGFLKRNEAMLTLATRYTGSAGS